MNHENEYIKNFFDDDVDDDEAFIIFERIRSNIFNSIFAFKITTFEKKNRLKNWNLRVNEKKKTANNSNNIKIELYYSFNNSIDFVLTLWFNDIDCTKKNVNKFFKKMLLKSFRIDFQQQNEFHSKFNFKNENEWLKRLNKIFAKVQNDDDWQQIKLMFCTKMKNENEKQTTTTVQYKNVKKIVKFFLKHVFFVSNLIYFSIKQFNDDENKIYIEMHTANWW